MKHTLSSDTTVVDFGAHLYPTAVTPDGFDWGGMDELVGRDRLHDPETARAEMAEAGVDAVVVSNTLFMGHDDAAQTAASNDALWNIVEPTDALYGLASIPVGAGGEAAAAEFQRSIDTGFNGGGLHETTVGLTDDEMEPVLDVADRTGAPIFVHIPNLPSVEYRFNATFGRERAQQESISRVIHEEVYDRYPDLRIVWHHLGGNIAAMLGRVHLHTDPGRWPNQGPMKSSGAFKTDLEERVYVDTAGFYGYSAPLRCTLEEIPASQVLFGTDYPWEPRSSDETRRFVAAVCETTNRRDAERILGQNALDVLVNTD